MALAEPTTAFGTLEKSGSALSKRGLRGTLNQVAVPGARVNYSGWMLSHQNRTGSPRSRNCSEERPDACGHRHRQCTPERDAYRAHRHARAARACSQPA
jgi:hypothetical protein